MKVGARVVLFAVTVPLLGLMCSGCGQGVLQSGENPDSANGGAVSGRLIPKVDTITPNQGPAAGGTRVTITGGPFYEDQSADQIGVLFGAHAAVDPIVVNSRMITAFAPPQASGLVDVTVITDAGQVTVLGAFTYTDAAVGGVANTEPGQVDIADISPAQGPIDGGTLVTIDGDNFSPDTLVRFDGIVADSITVLSSQLLTATTPPHAAGAVDVQVLSEGTKDSLVGGFVYGPMFDDGTDSDGDGLTDVEELTGWEVWIDTYSQALGRDTYTNTFHYAVTSDPNDDDTDDDGLTDDVELRIKSDPRKVDSDGDGLWDEEEWNRWLSSPTSVDSDGDARGDPDAPLAPDASLFDGLELYESDLLRLPPADRVDPVTGERRLKPRATSPTLADTDGDGVSDADEADSTVRNGVLADLPRLDYELVGDVDVRLNVEYAETIGESKEYGVTLTQSKTNTVASSFSNTVGWSVDVGVSTSVGIENGLVPVPVVETTISVNAGVHGEYTWTNSNETSTESSKESSRVQTDSLEYTETAADGEITTAILLRNRGNSTFTLTGLGVLAQLRATRVEMEDRSTPPSREPKTIATLTPIFDSITLAPGEVAGPFELAATEVNAQVIKELLSNPNSLLLGTASLNLQDESGLDFDYVRQFTIAQTANITIDFGDGKVRSYNVATNVDRNPDSSYRGITVERVFKDVLGLIPDDAQEGWTTRVANDGHLRLDSLLGRGYVESPGDEDCPQGKVLQYWTIMTPNPDNANLDLNDIVLRAGEFLHLMYQRDDDCDSVTNTVEKFAGTDQLAPGPDADGDGLPDEFEISEGWIAFEDPADPDAPHPDDFAKFRVYPSPTRVDSDGDGLDDDQEWEARSDPFDPDSDGDGLLDGVDPLPTRRSGIRFVSEQGNDNQADLSTSGRTWEKAYRTIQRALADADGFHADPADDVSQIWVARGVYKPVDQLTPIQMRPNVGIYGGFSGPGDDFPGETKRGQRNTNPFSNGCVITGDLADCNPDGTPVGCDMPDIGEIDLDTPGTYDGNCPAIISANYSNGQYVSRSAVLDGFMITGAWARGNNGALNLEGSPTIQNCLITRNANQYGGAGVLLRETSSPLFKNCILAGNVAWYGAGAFIDTHSGHVVFEDCEFSQNEARVRLNQSGGIANGGGVAIGGTRPSGDLRVDFNRCVFTGNQAWNRGGGIYAIHLNGVEGNPLYVRVDGCRFNNNLTTRTDPLSGVLQGSGGAMHLDADASVSNSVFWDNRAALVGGGIAVISGLVSNSIPHHVAITNCTFAYNRSLYSDWAGGGIFAAGPAASVAVQNTIAWQNWYGLGTIPDPGEGPDEARQIWTQDGAIVTVRNSCFNGGWPNRYSGGGNINDDPSLSSLELGDLSLGDQSPVIDRGNTFVDLDPLLPGFQQLPQFDLFGNPRIVDGNGDGVVAVDIGAFEAPAPR